MRLPNIFAIASVAFLLGACGGKGIDRKLDTGHGPDAYKTSLGEAVKDMTQEDGEAFDWAVSDLSIEALNQRYPNATPRSIIQGESKLMRDRAPQQITQLESVKPKYDAILAEMTKLTTSNAVLTMERNFHGLQPTVVAQIQNNSRLPVSQLKWRASLYLDDQKTPVATSDILDVYNNSFKGNSMFGSPQQVDAGGLPAGATAKRSFTIGFVSGDPNWTTLEVQNAKARRVLLEPIVESVKDFGNRAYLGGAPYNDLKEWKRSLATAEKLAKY
jgi:hypothetical protein